MMSYIRWYYTREGIICGQLWSWINSSGILIRNSSSLDDVLDQMVLCEGWDYLWKAVMSWIT